MLQDAALLHLDLMREALAEDMILKDASPYNVQWRGARPVFIDIPSFEPLAQGCAVGRIPAVLRAVPLSPDAPGLQGRRLPPLASRAHRRHPRGRDAPADVPARSGAAGRAASRRCAKCAPAPLFGQQAQRARNPSGSRLRQGADPQQRRQARRPDQPARARAAQRTEWSDYDRTHSYDAAEAERKAAFVREVAATRRWRLAWDLGCNTGSYARILAEHSDCVVAMDGDPEAIEALYRNEKAVGRRPDPAARGQSGGRLAEPGLAGRERKGLAERGRPELTLCLALDPSHRHLRQHPARGVHRLAGRHGNLGRDRVRLARG